MGKKSSTFINPMFIRLLEELAALTPEEIACSFANEYAMEFTPGINPNEVPVPSQGVD